MSSDVSQAAADCIVAYSLPADAAEPFDAVPTTSVVAQVRTCARVLVLVLVPVPVPVPEPEVMFVHSLISRPWTGVFVLRGDFVGEYATAPGTERSVLSPANTVRLTPCDTRWVSDPQLTQSASNTAAYTANMMQLSISHKPLYKPQRLNSIKHQIDLVVDWVGRVYCAD